MIRNDANSIPIWAEGVNRLALPDTLARQRAIEDLHPKTHLVGFDLSQSREKLRRYIGFAH